MGWQIAIDGPAGSGKSTIAKGVAQRLGFKYIDTGAMYRAVTLKAINLKINLEDEKEYQFLETTKINFDGLDILLDNVNVSQEIRSLEVTNKVSLPSKFGYVREKLVALQRQIASNDNVIMDGRDIGTVVLANANLKIYLTADVTIRAERRMKERLETNGIVQDLQTTIQELLDRDYKDSHRLISPLTKADDAIEIDSSDLSIEEVIDKIISLVLERGYRMENLEQKNEQLEEEKDVKDEVSTVEEEANVEGKEEEEKAGKYRELQVVMGTVVDVIPAQEAKKINKKEIKAKEEKVLIELEDGQQGYLFKKDAYGLADDEELFDRFVEGDKVEVAIKKIFPDGGKFVFSTQLVEMKKQLAKYEDLVKEKPEDRPIITVKVVKNIPVGLLTRYEDFSCLIPKKPKSLLNIPEEELDGLVGKELEVVPVRIDYSRIRIIASQAAASMKKSREAENAFIQQLEVGQVYDGVVKNIEKYGAFVEIGNGVEGLLHISEIDHNRVFKIEKVLNTGDSVKVQIINLDGKHIGLSRKALLPNYWGDYIKDKEVGSVVKGKAVDIKEVGVTVELAENVNGFLPKSEFSWDNDLAINDCLKVGDDVEAKVIEIDDAKKRIILSKKQLTENPWSNVSFKVGDVVEGTVAKELAQGFKVNIGNVSGYLSKNSLRNRAADSIQLGEKLNVKVRVLEPENAKLIVNLYEHEEKVEKENYGKYMKSQEKISNTLGDYFASLKNKK